MIRVKHFYPLHNFSVLPSMTEKPNTIRWCTAEMKTFHIPHTHSTIPIHVLSLLLSLLLSLVFLIPLQAQQHSSKLQGWDVVPAILKRITAPVFPKKDYEITAFGAKGDGVTDCSAAIAQAIEKCSKEKGGRVVIPKGVYLTGSIHLKSNVNLHLAEGSILKFSTESQKYLPLVFTRWEGIECMNYSALIYAFEQENIAVTGKGILDGQGAVENWWSWKGSKETGANKQNQNEARKKLGAMGEEGVPVPQRVFGEGSYLRPNFFTPVRCKNVLVEGVTFKDSPMWFLHPVLCRNVTILGVTTEGQGPNNDGCDPESCTDVLIKNCKFNNGDDCIAIKSGRNNDGRRVNAPSKNIIIQGCFMKNGHGGVVIGSEISGGVRNVYAEDCSMDSPNLDRVLRIKTNAVRGGVIENIYMRNVTVGQVAEAVVKIDFYYEEGEKGNFTPIVRNIDVRNVVCSKSRFGIWIRAYDRSPATKISLENCTFNNVAEPNVLENVKDLTMINVRLTYQSSSRNSK
ncbi:MAG: glycoside hydrolase family 28 protein [bacterium]